MKRHLLVLLAVAVCAVCLNIFAATSQDKLKSRHYRMQGVQQEVNGNISEAYALYRRAYELDPSDTYGGFLYARTSLFVADSARLEHIFDLMKAYLDEYPGETVDAKAYASLCARTDRNEEAMRVLKRALRYAPTDKELLVSIVQLSLNMNEPDSALSYTQMLTDTDGDEMRYAPFIISAYLDKGDTITMERYLDDKSATEKSDPYYHLVRAMLRSSFGKDDAEKYFLEADSLFPNNYSVKHALASYYHEKGDSVRMQKAVREALLCEDADITDKMEEFNAYVITIMSGGKLDAQTDAMMENLLTQYPYSAELRALGAEYYMAREEPAKAIENIQIAVDMEPEEIMRRATFIRLLVSMERYTEAIRVYENAVDYDHDYPDLEMLMGSVYLTVGEYDKAIATADMLKRKIFAAGKLEENTELLSLTDNQINTYFNEAGTAALADLADLYASLAVKRENMDEAVKYYEMSLKLYPGAMTKNNYAYVLAEHDMNLERADTLSKEAVDEAPENATFLDTYAYVLFKRGEYAQALEYIKKALEYAEKEGENATSYEYYEHYGDILSMTGDMDEALKMWKKALCLKPDSKILSDKIKAKKYIDHE